jgi:hypothetical protein
VDTKIGKRSLIGSGGIFASFLRMSKLYTIARLLLMPPSVQMPCKWLLRFIICGIMTRKEVGAYSGANFFKYFSPGRRTLGYGGLSVLITHIKYDLKFKFSSLVQ